MYWFHYKGFKKWNCFTKTGLNTSLVVSIVTTATSVTKIISCKYKFHVPPKERCWFLSRGRGILGLIFAGYVPLASQSPYPIIVWACKCNFPDPNFSHFRLQCYWCTYLINPLLLKWIDPFFKVNEEHFTFHLQYTHSGKFANREYEELSYPKNPKMCDPILVTHGKCNPIIVNPVVKMRCHPAANSISLLQGSNPSPGISLSHQNFFLARSNAKSHSVFLWVVLFNLTIFWVLENSLFLFRTPKSC